jgi:hypothetical protein
MPQLLTCHSGTQMPQKPFHSASVIVLALSPSSMIAKPIALPISGSFGNP